MGRRIGQGCEKIEGTKIDTERNGTRERKREASMEGIQTA